MTLVISFSGLIGYNSGTGTEMKEFQVDCDHNDMAVMLNYAFTRDTAGIEKDNCLNLLTLADFYGCEDLLKYCVDYYMKHFLALDMVVEIFEAIIFLNDLELGQELKILNESLWNFVLRDFVKIGDEILVDLPYEIFSELIASNRLNVKVRFNLSYHSENEFQSRMILQDEKVVWEKIVKWLEHKPERIRFFSNKMFKSCRHGLMPEGVSR